MSAPELPAPSRSAEVELDRARPRRETPEVEGPTFALLTPAELVRLTAEVPDAAEGIAALFDAGYVIAKRVDR